MRSGPDGRLAECRIYWEECHGLFVRKSTYKCSGVLNWKNTKWSLQDRAQLRRLYSAANNLHRFRSLPHHKTNTILQNKVWSPISRSNQLRSFNRQNQPTNESSRMTGNRISTYKRLLLPVQLFFTTLIIRTLLPYVLYEIAHVRSVIAEESTLSHAERG